jgi:hypothetical protein
MPACAFCHNPANSAEHVWAAWISGILPSTRYNNERKQGEARNTWTTARIDQTARVVCEECNETWMSDLEGRVKDLLTPMLRDGKKTTLTPEDMWLLSAYAFKQAVIGNYQSLALMPEPIFTRAERERFRYALIVPPDVRIWISAFQGRARFSGLSNLRYARSTNDPPPLNDLDVYSYTYAAGHLVLQLLAYRWNSVANRGMRVEFPEQPAYWAKACQRIWPTPNDPITWPLKYIGQNMIDAFVDRWFGQILLRS